MIRPKFGQMWGTVWSGVDLTEIKQASNALRQSEERYRQIVESASDVIYRTNTDGYFTFVNPVALTQIGYTEVEMMNMRYLDIIRKDFRERMEHFYTIQLMRGRKTSYRECPIVSKDGREIWIGQNVELVYENDAVVGFQSVARDITSRVMIEGELKRSEARLSIIYEFAPDAYYLTDLKGTFVDGNRAAERVTGFQKNELIGKNMLKVGMLPVREIAKAVKLLGKNIMGQPTGPDVFALRRKDGKEVQLEISTHPIRIEKQRLVLGIARDISERVRAQDELRKARDELEMRVGERTAELADANVALKQSLDEKEVLLKEIHHRVKNNLQIISSLLYLQSNHLADSRDVTAFKESQHRVASMALIHEKLYRSRDLASLDFTQYIETLSSDLLKSYEVSQHQVGLDVRVVDAEMNLDVAIPCGLIINELVSNSLKYAFPNERRGTISIHLTFAEAFAEANTGKSDGDHKNLELVVADDGIGMPKDIDPDSSETLGLVLVRTLVQQLDGTMQVERSDGTRFRIKFGI